MFGAATSSSALAAQLRVGRSRICMNHSMIQIRLLPPQSRHHYHHHHHRWLSSSSSWSDHSDHDEDPYTVLGLDRSTVTADEVKRAFRALALQYHPDVNPGDDSAAQAFQKISAAYEDLKKGNRLKHNHNNNRSSSVSPYDKEEEDMDEMLAHLEKVLRKQQAANGGDGDGCGSCGTKSSQANADFTTRRQETTLMWNADGTGRVMRTVTTFESTMTGTRKLVQEVAVHPDTGQYQAGWHRQDGGWQEGGLAWVSIHDEIEDEEDELKLPDGDALPSSSAAAGDKS